MLFEECIPIEQVAGDEWRAELAERLNGGFGGTNGGVLAAICLRAARSAAPGYVPAGIDARFIRSFAPGTAHLTVTTLNRGRTLACVSVDVVTEAGKLATRGTVSLVNPDTLEAVDRSPVSPLPEGLTDYKDARAWRQPHGQDIPLIDTFSPRAMGVTNDATVTGTTVLWDDPRAVEEAACIAADISVGPPVARALKGLPLAMPNPDLTLRFTGLRNGADHLVADCRLQGIAQGLATTSLTVYGAGDPIAIGISTTTCLKSGR